MMSAADALCAAACMQGSFRSIFYAQLAERWRIGLGALLGSLGVINLIAVRLRESELLRKVQFLRATADSC